MTLAMARTIRPGDHVLVFNVGEPHPEHATVKWIYGAGSDLERIYVVTDSLVYKDYAPSMVEAA